MSVACLQLATPAARVVVELIVDEATVQCLQDLVLVVDVVYEAETDTKKY